MKTIYEMKDYSGKKTFAENIFQDDNFKIESIAGDVVVYDKSACKFYKVINTWTSYEVETMDYTK